MKTVLVAPFDPVTTKEIEYARSLLKKKDISTVYLLPWGKGVLSVTQRTKLLKAAIMPYGHLETTTSINREDQVYCMDDAEDEDEYFEFEIHVEPLTGDVALIITDFVDEDEESDSISVWDKQIESLHRNLGA